MQACSFASDNLLAAAGNDSTLYILDARSNSLSASIPVGLPAVLSRLHPPDSLLS